MGFGKNISFFSEPGDLIIPPTFQYIQAQPVDNSSSVSGTFSVTPPSDMNKGDLVIVIITESFLNTPTHTIVNAGGQTWTTIAKYQPGGNLANTIWFCTFNGTWTANPVFTTSEKTSTARFKSFQFLQYRGYRSDVRWSVSTVTDNNSGSATSITPGIVNPLQNRALPFVVVGGLDGTRTFSYTGSKWSQDGLSAQYRNPSGTSGVSGVVGIYYQLKDYYSTTSSLVVNFSGAISTSFYRKMAFYQNVI